MTLEPWIEKQRDKYVVRWRDTAGKAQTDKGYRYRSRSEAKPRRDVVRQLLKNKSYGQVDESKSVAACFDAFLVEQAHHSSARIHQYNEAVKSFLLVSKVTTMGQIVRKVIIDYKTELYRLKRSDHTIHTYLGVIGVWMKWAKNREWILENPYIDIEAPLPKPVDRFLTDAELIAIERVIDMEDFRCIYRLGYMVGLRPQEILKSKSEHLLYDADKNLWTLRIPPDSSKTSVGRMVALPPMVVALLPKREGLLFPDWSRKRMGRHFANALRRAELPILVERKNQIVRKIFYWTRHSFARRFLEKGGPLRILSILMGHASIKITADTYGHLEKTFVIDQAHAISAVMGQLENSLTEINMERNRRAITGQNRANDDIIRNETNADETIDLSESEPFSDGELASPTRAHSSIG